MPSLAADFVDGGLSLEKDRKKARGRVRKRVDELTSALYMHIIPPQLNVNLMKPSDVQLGGLVSKVHYSARAGLAVTGDVSPDHEALFVHPAAGAPIGVETFWKSASRAGLNRSVDKCTHVPIKTGTAEKMVGGV